MTFSGAQSGKGYVIQICQGEGKNEEGQNAKVDCKLQSEGRCGDRRSISSRGFLAFLASWNSDPPRISSLIKQCINQCSKDYYE